MELTILHWQITLTVTAMCKSISNSAVKKEKVTSFSPQYKNLNTNGWQSLEKKKTSSFRLFFLLYWLLQIYDNILLLQIYVNVFLKHCQLCNMQAWLYITKTVKLYLTIVNCIQGKKFLLCLSPMLIISRLLMREQGRRRWKLDAGFVFICIPHINLRKIWKAVSQTLQYQIGILHIFPNLLSWLNK